MWNQLQLFYSVIFSITNSTSRLHYSSSIEGKLNMNQHGVATSTKEKEDVWTLSIDKPHMQFIATKSQVLPPYTLAASVKMRSILPPDTVLVLVVLHCRHKKWKMHYREPRFDIGWKSFVIDNKIKVGDGCVFELMECSSTTRIEFRVQILDGDIPPQLLQRSEGSTSDNPINLD